MAAAQPYPYVSPEPYTAYLDESGDHSLQVVDPSYPIFGLAGVLLENAEHARASATLTAWKIGFFGRDVTLHMREINRALGDFAPLSSRALRARFWTELCAHVDAIDFSFSANMILKQDHVAQYGAGAQDPYNLTLEFIVERMFFDMRDKGSRVGFIAESRKPHLNAALLAHYHSLMTNGTRYVAAADLQARLHPTMAFQGKRPGAIGLQLADLVAGPVCREVLGKANAQCVNYNQKYRQSWDGRIDGYGRKVFP
jgi:hypothetical protein